MSTELIKTIPVIEVEGLTPIQKGWVRLADLKVLINDKLTKGELDVQQKVAAALKSEDLATVQTVLKEVKDIATENKDARLYFTNMVKEKVTDPLMVFEKRNEALITELGQKEFTLRKAANSKQEAERDKKTEENQLKAHIQNEHLRIGHDYRSRLAKLISDAYTTALKDKVPVDTIKNYVKQIHNFLAAEKLSPFIKFERRYVSDAEAQAIYKSIEPYKSKADLEAALESLEQTFSMYKNDLANSKKAIAAEKKRAEDEAEAERQRIERETATNTLVGQADTYYLEETKGAKTTIKKQYEMEDENTPEWCFCVLAAFMGNIGTLQQYIKVKTWSKLTIGQMCTAIAKLHSEKGVKFPDLKFKVIEK